MKEIDKLKDSFHLLIDETQILEGGVSSFQKICLISNLNNAHHTRLNFHYSIFKVIETFFYLWKTICDFTRTIFQTSKQALENSIQNVDKTDTIFQDIISSAEKTGDVIGKSYHLIART